MTTVSVGDTKRANTHHISLAESGGSTYGLIVKDDIAGIQEGSISPSSLQFSEGRSGYGSFEAPFSSIDQVDWTGGRGQLKFDDPSEFFDSYNAWTLTEGIWTPAPLWRFSKGYRNADYWMPGDTLAAGNTQNTEINWRNLYGNNQYIAVKFTASATYSAKNVWVFLKYTGSPGNLTVELCDDSTGDPGTVNKDVVLSSTYRSDALPEGAEVGQLVCFQVDGTESLTATTDYWVKIYGAAADDADDHWSIGCGTTGNSGTIPTCKYFPDSSWTAVNTEAPYYRVTDAEDDATIHFFEYKRGMYAATEPVDGSAGAIYRNGDRGVAQGTHSSTTLQDTDKSWTADEWIGCWVHIWNGTGEGQYRKITDNDGDTLTVEPAFDITPVDGAADTGSEYVIIGSNKWTNVTPTTGGVDTITKPITDVFVMWGVIYFCQGEEAYVLKCREYNDAGTWTTFWAGSAVAGTSAYDGTNYALYMRYTYDPVNEHYIWRIRNENPAEWTGTFQTSVSKSDDVVWGSNNSYGNPVPIGTRDYLINNAVAYNNKLYIGKEDSLWYLDYDGEYDRAYPVQIGLEAMAGPNNFKAMIQKDLYLYFSWAHSLERYYGSTLDDIGPWKGTGMLPRAQGVISDMQASMGWIFCTMDSGSEKQSSVLVHHHGFHTLFRAPSLIQYSSADFDGDKANPRIRKIHWQSIEGKDAMNRLWFQMGGDIMFMEFPRTSLNPTHEENMMYAPEAYVTQSRMDANYAELEKYYHKAKVVCPETDGTIYIDYATNPAIGEPTFTNAGSGTTTSTTPRVQATIGQSRKRDIIIRARLSVTDMSAETKNVVQAMVLDAVARKPTKMTWTFRVRLKPDAVTLTGETDHDHETLWAQLIDWAGQDGEMVALTARCPLHSLDEMTVFVDRPSKAHTLWSRLQMEITGWATITLVEV